MRVSGTENLDPPLKWLSVRDWLRVVSLGHRVYLEYWGCYFYRCNTTHPLNETGYWEMVRVLWLGHTKIHRMQVYLE